MSSIIYLTPSGVVDVKLEGRVLDHYMSGLGSMSSLPYESWTTKSHFFMLVWTYKCMWYSNKKVYTKCLKVWKMEDGLGRHAIYHLAVTSGAAISREKLSFFIVYVNHYWGHLDLNFCNQTNQPPHPSTPTPLPTPISPKRKKSTRQNSTSLSFYP